MLHYYMPIQVKLFKGNYNLMILLGFRYFTCTDFKVWL